MSNKWEGKHIWIWELDKCGGPAEVVAKAVNLGLAGLLVKGWDGSNYWKQIESIVGLAHNAGLVIGAWGYSYGTKPAGEAAAAKKCLVAGADWLIIDAEAEYEQSPGRADAVLAEFKSLGAIMGYSSFGLPRYHPGFPWQKFSKACDVVLPQVYWGDFGMKMDKALSESISDLKPYNLPIAPVGQLYGNVSPDDITRFANLSETAGLPGVSYWSWQHAGDTRLTAVGAAGYKKGSDTVSDWAKASWDKAVAKGIVDGTNPKGNVTREMLAVILDRCGLLDAYYVPQEVVDSLKDAGIITSPHKAGWRPTWGELASVVKKLSNLT
jgi:hypothetical protein